MRSIAFPRGRFERGDGLFSTSGGGWGFDCVVMSQVLEHLENPREILAGVAKVLKAGGRLLLVQTHWLGVMPQRYGGKWYAWVPEQHFWHFTPQGIEASAAAGFQQRPWSI